MAVGEHGHHGVAVVPHVVVAPEPAPGSATHLHLLLDAATALVLLLTLDLATRHPVPPLVRKHCILIVSMSPTDENTGHQTF